MPETIIIADASCIISLDNIGELYLLRKMFDEITITPEVADEFGEPLPDWIKIKRVVDEKKMRLLELELDRGEASAIALALEQVDSLLLIDERKGREIAQRVGLKIMGILGTLIWAKEKGVIGAVKPLLEKLESNDFRISKSLKERILRRTSET
ncbi:MAG: DUF3368 domain-containing protein [Pricia sp.]